MSQLPQQPWNEGDKFTNDATGVEYTFDGVKWLASGGEELDLSSYVSKAGDVMTGPLETPSIKTGVIEPEKWWGIDLIGALNVDNDDKPAVSIMKNGYSQMELSAVGSVSLWNGYTDFQPNDLVTKEYVDGCVDEVASALPSDPAQPVNIGTQTLEVLGSRPTGSGGKAGFMQVWKAETGGPGSPFNEAKFIVPDTSVIDLTATQLWLKQGNIVQRWENGGGGWFTNGNVYHVSGNLTEGDDLVDGQPVELYYSDPNADFLDVISKKESKADDQALQAQIDALSTDYVSKTGGNEMEGPLTVNDKGINVVITNPNAVDTTHPDYDEYSRYPLRIKSPSNYNRFAVRVDDGGGPYSLDEKGKPFQGNHPNYLATIGLLQDKAVKAYPDEVVSMGGLSLSVVGSISDTDDCLYTEAKILSDYSKIVLNHDPLDSGQRVDWLARFPGDSTMFIQQGDQVFTLETTAVTAAGTNNRAKHFNIRSHNIPQAGLSDARIDVGQIFNEGSEPYLVGQEEFKASNNHLQTQIDELEQEIDIIAPRLEGAQYKYASSYAVKPGEMFIASNSFTAATDVVFFNDVALDGTTHAWGSLHEGDYLEITDTQEKSGRTAENYAMYLCTKEPEGTGIKQIEVALVKGAGAPTVGDVLDAKGFELGGNEINDLDSRYDLKQSHLKEYRAMKVQGKHYSYNNFTQIPAESNCLNMTNTGFKNSCGFIMKDLDAWFPRDKYDFIPGMVTVLEPYIHPAVSGRLQSR